MGSAPSSSAAPRQLPAPSTDVSTPASPTTDFPSNHLVFPVDNDLSYPEDSNPSLPVPLHQRSSFSRYAHHTLLNHSAEMLREERGRRTSSLGSLPSPGGSRRKVVPTLLALTRRSHNDGEWYSVAYTPPSSGQSPSASAETKGHVRVGALPPLMGVSPTRAFQSVISDRTPLPHLRQENLMWVSGGGSPWSGVYGAGLDWFASQCELPQAAVTMPTTSSSSSSILLSANVGDPVVITDGKEEGHHEEGPTGTSLPTAKGGDVPEYDGLAMSLSTEARMVHDQYCGSVTTSVDVSTNGVSRSCFPSISPTSSQSHGLPFSFAGPVVDQRK